MSKPGHPLLTEKLDGQRSGPREALAVLDDHIVQNAPGAPDVGVSMPAAWSAQAETGLRRLADEMLEQLAPVIDACRDRILASRAYGYLHQNQRRLRANMD